MRIGLGNIRNAKGLSRCKCGLKDPPKIAHKCTVDSMHQRAGMQGLERAAVEQIASPQTVTRCAVGHQASTAAIVLQAHQRRTLQGRKSDT